MRRSPLVLLPAALMACKDPAPEGQRPADPAVSVAAPCDVVDARGTASKVDVSDFDDPVARLLLTEGCPASFEDVAQRLAKRDDRECLDDGFSPTRTTLLSERAQLRGTPEGSTDECSDKPIAIFRGVVQRRCGGRPSYGLFASLAPLATIQKKLPDTVELIGFDPTAKRFRFYTREEGGWRYHGDSVEMLDGVTADGARRCAACHVGGGLVMKELDAPWLHWEGRTTTAGVQAMLSRYEALGSRSHGVVTDFRPAGQELEEAIVAGNEAWMKTRIEHQRTHATLARLLRPLFCDEEINIRTAAQSPSSPTHAERESGSFELPVAGFLAARRLVGAETIAVSVAHYHAAVAAAGQRIQTFCDKPLRTDDDAVVVDTAFDFAYPHRAAIDNLAVATLVEENIVDEAFVRGVLAVDLTRPVFSEARCSLLAEVPDVPPEDRSPAKIRAAVLEAVADSTTPAAQELRANLSDDARDPAARVSALLRACGQRPPEALAADLNAYASALRRKARALPLLELPEVLPVDDLPERPGLHIDAKTCTLVEDAPAQHRLAVLREGGAGGGGGQRQSECYDVAEGQALAMADAPGASL
ncbi:MAG: hypothetical protein AAF721_00830, partial [Myxococcota bacterium]